MSVQGYLSPPHPENGEEDVDDIQVELERGVDVLLGADGVLLAAHQLLGVDDEEHGEEQPHQARVDEVHHGHALGQEEDGDEAEAEEHPGGGEQVDLPAGEVPLGLEAEEGQAEAEGSSQAHRDHHPVDVVENGCEKKDILM